MTAHVSSSEIARYLARALPPEEVLALHNHVEMCRDCRRALEEASLAHMPWVNVPLLSDTADPHLTEEEMVALVGRRLAEPRQTEAVRHVAECQACRDSVTAMKSVRNQPIPMWRSTAVAIAAVALLAALVHYWPRHSSLGPSVRPAPAIVVSLRDAGETVELDSSGALRGLEGAPPEERTLVRDALRQRSLPAGPGLPAEAPGVLLAPDATAHPLFSLIAPIHTRVIPDRPVFTWQSYPGASAYQVLVTNENLDPLARSGRMAVTEWQPGSPLPRGVILLWQVRAWRGGEMVSAPAPPAPPARFEIAGERIAARLEQLRKSPRPSHLLMAVICAREGLRDETAKEMQSLARENPDSALVRSLRTSLAAR